MPNDKPTQKPRRPGLRTKIDLDPAILFEAALRASDYLALFPGAPLRRAPRPRKKRTSVSVDGETTAIVVTVD